MLEGRQFLPAEIHHVLVKAIGIAGAKVAELLQYEESLESRAWRENFHELLALKTEAEDLVDEERGQETVQSYRSISPFWQRVNSALGMLTGDSRIESLVAALPLDLGASGKPWYVPALIAGGIGLTIIAASQLWKPRRR